MIIIKKTDKPFKFNIELCVGNKETGEEKTYTLNLWPVTFALVLAFLWESVGATPYHNPHYWQDRQEAMQAMIGDRDWHLYADGVGIDPTPWIEEMLESNPKLKGVRIELQIVMAVYWIRWGARIKIVEGLRTLERQKELKRKGFSKTLKSKHLTGMAVDFAPCYTTKCKRLMFGNTAGENWQIEREAARLEAYYDAVQSLFYFQYDFASLRGTSGSDFRHTGFACSSEFPGQKGCFRDSGHFQLVPDDGKLPPNPLQELQA